MPILAALAFILILAITRYSGVRNNRLVEQIESDFFPALELSYQLEKLAMKVQHTLQDAITVGDPDLIDEADGLRDVFVELLNQGRFIRRCEANEFDQFRTGFIAYYDLARPVTERMIHGGFSDELFTRVAAMNQQYDELVSMLHEATQGQEFEMQQAFERARKSRHLLQGVIFLTILLSMTLIIIMCVGLAISIVRPLRKITRVTEAIAHGKLDERLEYTSHDELGRLADSFRKMQYSLSTDIARREEAEAALRESEARFRSIFENATSGIVRTTPDGQVITANPAMQKMLGYSSLQDVLDSITNIGEQVYADPHQREEAIQALRERGEVTKEVRFLRKDGSEIDVQMYLWMVASEDGNLRFIEGIVNDISDRKQAERALKQAMYDIETANRQLAQANEELQRTNEELKATQIQLVQSEKMASLGALVAGIAHEINTPVGAMNSMHQTLVRAIEKLREILELRHGEDFTENRQIQATMKIIEDANQVISTGADRVTNIVRRLRSFARLDEAELKEADIHEGLDDTLTLVHHELKNFIKVIKNYGDIPPVVCYPGQLNQVFLNLLVNARQAIKETGEITITTYKKDDRVYIEIQDTGTGIPKENLSKVFNPGFTTKGVGVGTGLGLSICYQIIEAHHGRIEVESDVGKGTKFTIVLPTDTSERNNDNGDSTSSANEKEV